MPVFQIVYKVFYSVCLLPACSDRLKGWPHEQSVGEVSAHELPVTTALLLKYPEAVCGLPHISMLCCWAHWRRNFHSELIMTVPS